MQDGLNNYKQFVRWYLEYQWVVIHSSLTEEHNKALEHCQVVGCKAVALRIISRPRRSQGLLNKHL